MPVVDADEYLEGEVDASWADDSLLGDTMLEMMPLKSALQMCREMNWQL